jgi:hypothetical protein
MKQFLQKFSTETQLSEPQVAGQINDKLRELTAVKSTTPYKAPQELDLFEEKTFALYTIDDQGELEELKSLNQAETVDVLIFVNTITKNIYKIIMHDNLSQRMLFLAGKAASQLNLNKFRSQCNVKDVSDMMMRNYLLDRITIIFKEYGMNSEANQ